MQIDETVGTGTVPVLVELVLEAEEVDEQTPRVVVAEGDPSTTGGSCFKQSVLLHFPPPQFAPQ